MAEFDPYFESSTKDTGPSIPLTKKQLRRLEGGRGMTAEEGIVLSGGLFLLAAMGLTVAALEYAKTDNASRPDKDVTPIISTLEPSR